MDLEAQEPTFEIILRLEGNDVAVVAAFADGKGGYDLVAGTDDSTRFPLYVALVEHTCEGLRDIASWEDISVLRQVDFGGNETGAAPF